MFGKIGFLIKRDLVLNFSNSHHIITPVIFFLISLSIFPFAISNDPKILKLIGPGVMLCMLLLSSCLVGGHLFEDDYEDGTIEQLFLSLVPGYVIMIGKIIIHYLCVICPILAASLGAGLFYSLSFAQICIINLIFLLASPLFSASACLGAVIALNSKKSSFIGSLISLPLNISVIIFTLGAIDNAINHISSLQSISILLGLALILLPLSCFFGGIIINNATR